MPDDPGLLWRAVSVLGFLCLVGGYIANQRGWTRATSNTYLAANTLGAGLLAAYSAVIEEWVFVGLEGFWLVATLSAWVGRPRGEAE